MKFSASKVETSTLSDAARQAVGNHPVYNLSVTSGSSTISQFGGAVTVSLPYTSAAGENANAIVAYYINADGEPELMQNCYYDAEAGALVFTTTHFSVYAVGYNKIAFSDVSDSAWYADAVSYLAARGITGGTSETKFSPDATLTRGQFITLFCALTASTQITAPPTISPMRGTPTTPDIWRQQSGWGSPTAWAITNSPRSRPSPVRR